MSLTTVLHRYALRTLVGSSPLPTVLHVQISAKVIAERFDATANAPTNEDLRDLLQRFRRGHETGGLEHFTRREWTKATWGIWDSSFPLSGLDRFWPEFRTFLRTQGRRSQFKNLILTYLRDFDAEDTGIGTAARLIREYIAEDNQADWLWTRRHAELALFDPKHAPLRVASLLLAGERSSDAALVEAGFHGVAAGGGMERAAFGEAMQTLRQALGTNPEQVALLRRVLDWAKRDDDLRFPTLRRQLAETLLLPWRTAHPSNDIQGLILSFLLTHYRDPRLYRQGWVGVAEAAQKVFRRWLTKESLEQFISVVTRVAKGSHWKYRKSFWMAYYERDYIDEAWVLFGPEARYQAQQAFEEQTGFGQIKGGLQNHCVLLLRIGDLTIADWSHDGTCRIWNANNESAPDLYQATYRNARLQRSADFEQTHRGSERHRWQESVADYIHQKTGVWVDRSDRVPRGR